MTRAASCFAPIAASCHGTAARGNGPRADSLRCRPLDLTQFTFKIGGVFPSERVYRIIDGRDVSSHGDLEMPVWGDSFKRARGSTYAVVKVRIDAIVSYLASIQVRPAE
jgi:hypothetical protein